ncbi:hypothetical protein AB0L83_32070 [Streptomyces sp. NPDC052071]|uniref:hypothetical protein n=1 Tax=Streptomyces sp. NPDC052071 TaxID=3156666 RepID=UPI003420FC01
MYMIPLHLVGFRGTTEAPNDFKELLTAHFAPTDRIEHLWARTDPGRIDLVLFILADCEAEALLTARAACIRAVERTPRLFAWHLSDHTDSGHNFP